MSRIPHCLVIRLTDGGEIVSLTRRTLSTREQPFFFVCFWYPFLLEAK
jgi:hypothetical protein